MITLNKEFLESIKYFNTTSDRQLQLMLESDDNGLIEYAAKETVFHENDVGKYLYILVDGLAEVYVRSESSYRDISIATLKPGDIFGDGAATSAEEKRHSATIRTVLPSKIFRIHKRHVLNAMGDRHLQTPLPPNKIRDSLLAIPIFKGLTIQEQKDINLWSRLSFHEQNELVYEPGDTAKKLFVVMQGTVQFFNFDNNGKKKILSRATPGQYFGEMELLPGASWKYDHFAEVLTEARIILVSKDIFLELLDRNTALTGYLKKMHQLKKLNQTSLVG